MNPRRTLCPALLTFLLTLLSVFPAQAGESLEGVEILTPRVGPFEKVEIAIRMPDPPENPFDPNVTRVDALIRLPSGSSVKVPGFWFQDFQRSLQNPEAEGVDRIEHLLPKGQPEWRIRFSSRETGVHSVVVELIDRGGVSQSRELEFEVTPGDGRGFIRVSPRNRSFLEDEQGTAFFPIGQNLCMYPKREGTYYFDRILPKLVQKGSNYVRLWQEYYVPRDRPGPAGPGEADFTGFPLETQLTGLGRYDLASAWRLDHVADLCESLGVYWQLSSEMVVWWQRRQAHRWSRNPYNAENGGPCLKPSDYLVNENARELVRRRLRYNVARWGWSTKLAAWELWNEVDNLEGFTSEANAEWHREMAGHLKSIDPWRHLVTTSWRDPAMFGLPEIDIVQAHSYFGPEYDAAEYALQDTDHLMRPFGKPFFFGEQGIEGPVSVDPTGKHFHDCLWSSALSGAAGAGLYWWWHNYIEPFDLYRHYAPLAKFLSGIDWPGSQWKTVRRSRPNLPVSLKVYGLVSEDRALIWIHDPLAFRISEGQATKGPSQNNASINVVGLADGPYEIEWWDTSNGEVIRTDQEDVNHLRHFGYGLELKPPEFWGDIAARIISAGAHWRENP